MPTPVMILVKPGGLTLLLVAPVAQRFLARQGRVLVGTTIVDEWQRGAENENDANAKNDPACVHCPSIIVRARETEMTCRKSLTVPAYSLEKSAQGVLNVGRQEDDLGVVGLGDLAETGDVFLAEQIEHR